MSERRYFGTDGVRGVAGRHPMTASFALGLGVATAELLKAAGKARPSVVIGMDTRRSGPMLALALGAGLTSRGADVTDLGVVPTPAVSYLTRALGADAGIVVSASHNPFDDNGIKVFNSAGEKLDDDLEAELEDLVERVWLNGEAEPVVGAGLGRYRRLPREGGERRASDSYAAHLLANAPYLDGMKVVVDCANGAGHLLAPRIFAKIGARLEVMNARPDGENINVGCGSTSPEAVLRRVVEGGFDVGVTFDGDADRALLVDRRGRLVTGDHIMAICAVERGEREIVATHMSNLGMETYLRERGIGVRRVKVGDRYVYEELKRSGLTLGGEQSGHVLFLDKAPTGDGILTALQLLAAVRKSGRALEEWMDEIPVYPQELVNVAVPAEVKADVSDAPEVAAAVREAQDRLGDAGRVLIRPSGTEPLVRVMVEGPDHAAVRSVAQSVAEAVRRAGGAATAAEAADPA
ncbi:MAG TPA: phosphoglucosamine mutase [Trueperaceae bacterium]|jgi:phosphoglucosamine mutase